jgi:putative ABC transport system permease protein
MKLPITLALRDLRHDWQAAACFIAALVGVLAPLLIILALKNGVISTMVDRLVDDPSNRELIAVGAGRNDATFFTDIGQRSDVAFVMPATRSINTVANALRHSEARKLLRNVVLVPSGPGDPVLGDLAVSPGAVVLTASLAQDLAADVGAVIEMRIDRRIGDTPQTATRPLRVAGVLPAERYGRAALFLALPDLLAVEAFRDDGTITLENWTDPRPAPQTYAGFRLYANALGDVAGLERALAARSVAARPRAENVDLLISVQRALNLLFLVIAALAFAGFWAAMAANLRATVERQRISLSLLRLLGLSELGRRAIPTLQALVLVAGGVGVTLLFVVPTLMLINATFTPQGFDRIAYLGPMHVVWTLVLGLITAITASAWAVMAIGGISSDEVLRAA